MNKVVADHHFREIGIEGISKNRAKEKLQSSRKFSCSSLSDKNRSSLKKERNWSGENFPDRKLSSKNFDKICFSA